MSGAHLPFRESDAERIQARHTIRRQVDEWEPDVPDFAELLARFRHPWHAQAACTGMDTNIFFPTKGVPGRKARETCAGCPVRVECLEQALVDNEKHGIFGGVGERARRTMRKERAA